MLHIQSGRTPSLANSKDKVSCASLLDAFGKTLAHLNCLFLPKVQLLSPLKLCCFLGSSYPLCIWLSSRANTTVGNVQLTSSCIPLWNISSSPSSFESAVTGAGFLLLHKFGLGDRCDLHTRCWCSLVNILGEKDYCIEILLLLVWMNTYYGNCCEQLFTFDAIQQVWTFQPWIEAMVPIFHKISNNNMVVDMVGNILFPVYAFFSLSCINICRAISASEAVLFT